MDQEMNDTTPGPVVKPPTTVAPPERDDLAGRSLADALRWSFRLLSVIMIVVVIAFALTGVKSIQPYEEGVVKVFGKKVRTVKSGLVYTWPFPIGDVERIQTKQRTLTIKDFWMHETPQDTATPLESRPVSGRGLRPGYDGALLTGDRNLLHVRLECTYAVKDPVAYDRSIRDEESLTELLRSAICRATIQTAAGRTADAIQRTGQAQFLEEIRIGAQDELNTLTGADENSPTVRISRILLPGKTWPLRALAAYNAAQSARSKAEKRINSARAQAVKILTGACGQYEMLVGEVAGPSQQLADGEDAGYDLIGQYSTAIDAGDKEEAAKLMTRIDAVLLARPGGEVSRIINQARAEGNAIAQNAKGRADGFAKLIGEYNKAPRFTLGALWDQTRGEILSSPMVVKYHLAGGKKLVIRLSEDPQVAREVRKEELRERKSDGR